MSISSWCWWVKTSQGVRWSGTCSWWSHSNLRLTWDQPFFTHRLPFSLPGAELAAGREMVVTVAGWILWRATSQFHIDSEWFQKKWYFYNNNIFICIKMNLKILKFILILLLFDNTTLSINVDSLRTLTVKIDENVSTSECKSSIENIEVNKLVWINLSFYYLLFSSSGCPYIFISQHLQLHQWSRGLEDSEYCSSNFMASSLLSNTLWWCYCGEWSPGWRYQNNSKSSSPRQHALDSAIWRLWSERKEHGATSSVHQHEQNNCSKKLSAYERVDQAEIRCLWRDWLSCRQDLSWLLCWSWRQ